jgi:hypothetical protein
MGRETVIVSDPEILGARHASGEHVLPSIHSSTTSKPAIPWTNSWTTFPSVRREAAIAALEEAKALLTNSR